MSQSADDDELMSWLGEALARREGYHHRRDAARGAFAWRTIDADLMALQHDSSVSVGLAVRGPGGPGPRVLSFTGGGLTLEVELGDDQIMGQLLPPRVCEVTIESAQCPRRATETDASGFFQVAAADDHGPTRFAVQDGDETHTTEWVVL